jgi:hypothetical protein
MNDQEIVAFMVDSLNADNRAICQNNGMDPAEIEKSIEQSQQSLVFMMGNLYVKMKEKNLIA